MSTANTYCTLSWRGAPWLRGPGAVAPPAPPHGRPWVVDEEDHGGSGSEYHVEDDDEDDLSNKVVLRKSNAATSTLKLALETIAMQCIPGTRIVDLCLLGDKIMIEQVQSLYKKSKTMKKGIAFPTCISVNNNVRNVSPALSDTTVLSENDVVRIEMAAHIDGFIATMAHTVVVTDEPISGRIAKVIQAADTARKEVVRCVKPGIKKQEVFDGIESSVKAFACKVLLLKCCQLRQFQVDDGEDDSFELNKVYSVELLISSEEASLVQMDDVHSNVYKLLAEDEIPLIESIPRGYMLIYQKFQQMPFNNRALEELGIDDTTPLRSAGLLKTYPILCTQDGMVVVHFKFTMYVQKSGAVNMTYQKLQKLSLPKADVPGRTAGAKDTAKALLYCGKLPLGDNGSGVTPVVNDISWNLHKLYKKEKVLACTGSFGTYMFRRPNAVAGSIEDLEEGWSKVKLCDIAARFCEWCPWEGNILALGAIDPESNLGKIYLLNIDLPEKPPVLAFTSYPGTANGFNSLSWSKGGQHLLATFDGTNAFAVLTRTLRSVDTRTSYIRFNKSRLNKASFYGVFHPIYPVFFVASTAGMMKVYEFQKGDKGSVDGWYFKKSYDLHKSVPDPADIGFIGISISPSGNILTCLRTDGHIQLLMIDYEAIHGGKPFNYTVLQRQLDHLPHANLKFTGPIPMLAVVDVAEHITIYTSTTGDFHFERACDNRIDIAAAKRCHQLDSLDWHAHDLLACSTENGFVHFWLSVRPSRSRQKFAQKTRDMFSERMFYTRKLLQYGVGQTMAKEYGKIINALGEAASASTARVNLLEDKIQKSVNFALEVLRRIDHGETLPQGDFKQFLEQLLETLTTED